MDWLNAIRVFGCCLILLYLICGIDDTIWIICALISRLVHHKKSNDENLSFDTLRKTPPKMLAVSIASWHEANVIGDVITNFLNTTDYPKSMYHLFVGVYPNDPDTIAAVSTISKTFPNVHPIINCKNGPTTKAQNINHVIREIKRFEKEHQIRFASLTIHDSEDVIHTYELLATNYLIDSHDALQFPVFPILEMPRFRNFFRQLTTATYADEFAENHYITLVQRKNMNAFVPCAGTGFALSRKCIDQFGDGDVLPSESLTEDYLLSMILYKKGIPLHYVLDRLPRVMKNGKIRTDFITTRSLFPSTFRAAVKQKTRWTYGITMQAVHFRDIFQSHGVPLAGRYSFYKDLKAKLLNLLPLLGYIASIYGIAAIFLNLDPFYTPNSPVAYMAIAVLIMTIIRQVFRGYALYHVYGFRSVFFGCLLPPLFPIRLIYGNIINFIATCRAFLMKFSSRQPVTLKHTDKSKNPQRKVIRWAKTDHTFLSRDQLRRYRRMLGDTLIVQGYLTAEQFLDALDHVDKEHGQQIGAYLIQQGIITEEQMIRALGHVKHIQFIPDEVARRLDYEKSVKHFQLERLQALRILPLTVENETWIIGICNTTTDQDLQVFQEENSCKVKRMYLTTSFLQDALQSFAPSEAKDQHSRRKHLSSLRDYHAGLISYEQVVLIGIYAQILHRSESDIRQYMGLPSPQQSGNTEKKDTRKKRTKKRR